MTELDDHHDRILARLTDIEAEEGVRILYAVESGSRAWGFPSLDSDYDVRFVYAHPVEWYLSLDPGRDVIERPLDPDLIDLAGWDVRKALRLLLKSNPALSEWLRSPIVYRDDGAFRPAARALFDQCGDRSTLARAYASMAWTNWRAYLGDRTEVRPKKYFYAIRPCLCLLWIAETAVPPPMALASLLADLDVPESVRSAIADLQAAKALTSELGREPRVPVLDDWIKAVLDQGIPDRVGTSGPNRSVLGRAEAEALFRVTIGHVPTPGG
ncbi:DNA polymerase beta superfamily protein [Roseospira navarrensis]|uniref:DNA polymerase beta superfamily protein n=1 Tax=Roseospira navarrensis TaxID=140058 RepID=UPI0014794D69